MKVAFAAGYREGESPLVIVLGPLQSCWAEEEVCVADLLWTAPRKRKSGLPGLREGLLEERRARSALAGVLVRAGGSSGVGWPVRFLSARGGSCPEMMRYSTWRRQGRQASDPVLLWVLSIP